MLVLQLECEFSGLKYKTARMENYGNVPPWNGNGNGIGGKKKAG
jgi:hypothetical protein